MSKKKKRNSSFLISTIIAFLLSIFLTMASYLGGIYFGLFNNTLILDSMNRTSYYNAIIDYTTGKAEALAIPMGLPPEVFDNVFTLDETYALGRALIESDLSGKDYAPDTTNVEARIASNINIFLTEQNLTATDEQKTNIAAFAKSISAEYVNNLSIPYLSYYVQLRTMFSKLVLIGLPILLVLSAFAVFLLLKLHSWLHRALRYIAYSTIAASLMTAILPLFILIGGSYRHLNISPEYFYKFIVSYITQSVVTFLYISLLLAAVSVALVAVIYFRRKDLTKKKSQHHRQPRVDEIDKIEF